MVKTAHTVYINNDVIDLISALMLAYIFRHITNHSIQDLEHMQLECSLAFWFTVSNNGTWCYRR